MTPEQQKSLNVERFVIDSIEALLGRREDAAQVTLDAHIQQDLDLDSLEVAELSVMLEDGLGTDPYSEGLVPGTAREIVAFYE